MKTAWFLGALCAASTFVAPALVVQGPLAPRALAATGNPLAVPSTLPMQAPRFDLIRDTDYEPAFVQAMAIQAAEMKAIAHQKAAPTFDNTIVAMERSGRMLDRVTQIFYGVYQANTNPVLDRTETAIAPKLSQHQDSIYLDPALFRRVATLYARRAALGLTAEQAQLLDVWYQQFVHAGAQLSEHDKATLRTLNTQVSQLQTQFQQKLLAATRDAALVTDTAQALDGLDAATVDGAAKAARERKQDGKWLLSLQNTTQQPALTQLTDRGTRQALFDKSWTRAETGSANDTRATIAQIAQLRAQKAALFGYPDFASYELFDQMAKSPQTVRDFIAKLAPAVHQEEEREAAAVRKEMAEDKGPSDLRPWDWSFYADRLRQKTFSFDAAEARPYFELNTVLRDGVFFAANKLYGITFQQRTDLPVYNPDVMVFDVRDRDGAPLGLMYFDYFKRDNKNGGAWMSNFVTQSALLGTKPVIYNVANFPKAPDGQPQLITYEDVITMFHEFGHALHGLFAAQTYPTLSGTAVARDFVEFPSQFNEHWALDPAVFAHYARHYKTGAPMPAALVEKIKSSARFDRGYAMGELIAAAELDMEWHSLPASAPRQNVDAFETAALGRMDLDTALVPPRYRSSYFLHIWSNGYAAGYYAYLWTQMLADDAFAWFQAHGGLTRENGDRFRELVLSRGHTQDYAPMFHGFYGKDPDIDPMLRHRIKGED
ncbi:peptidyl-dipeptidase DCP [Ameyamaea chiangmaiensis NBRC 103196]|uniref:Dipeptidyl carboxypeptidase n=1 Tax=Ameyamaea chiangmaiensis TaxID=442969 RepID=A0A850P8E9_9PROT|nr:M3 family metallopeptidase [Ameyamaea chiangmaiensis]MBS4075939.1 M3 family metallopeptidase [Ameyamaea chiangmaiensis]NVN40188.1 M3 family metallopeptidase [Ameyamaea chiangmaiensis]GBQ61672.1 peptidyl-dipeptidase DCP [Ameyamaea chiangmaiensis NBRC 103196]